MVKTSRIPTSNVVLLIVALVVIAGLIVAESIAEHSVSHQQEADAARYNQYIENHPTSVEDAQRQLHAVNAELAKEKDHSLGLNPNNVQIVTFGVLGVVIAALVVMARKR